MNLQKLYLYLNIFLDLIEISFWFSIIFIQAPPLHLSEI